MHTDASLLTTTVPQVKANPSLCQKITGIIPTYFKRFRKNNTSLEIEVHKFKDDNILKLFINLS